MRFARLDHLQCLLVIKTMCTNPVWLIFHRHDLILEKERKIQKRKTYCLGNSLPGDIFGTQASKCDGVFFAKLVNGCKPLSTFVKMFYRRCLPGL